MKKLLITLGAALLFSSAAIAQKSRTIDPVKATEKMTEKLDLNDEQQLEVLALNKDFKVQIDKLSLSQETNRESMKEAYMAHKAKLAKVLSKEQMEILGKEESNRKQKMSRGKRAEQSRRMPEGEEMDMD